MAEKTIFNIDDTLYETEVPSRAVKRSLRTGDPREIRAFIPGIIGEIRVKTGQQVTAKDVILYLEAMKMFNEVISKTSGQVAEILVKSGQRVEKGQLLVRLT